MPIEEIAYLMFVMGWLGFIVYLLAQLFRV